ncbi:MAG: precorrin-2 C(20)-methyltransferase, partial [Dongiaceae bacterium]
PAPLPEAELRARLAAGEAAAIVKVGRHLGKVRRVLGDLGLTAQAKYIERATLAVERVLPLDAVAGDEAPYFSMVLVHRRGAAWR